MVRYHIEIEFTEAIPDGGVLHLPLRAIQAREKEFTILLTKGIGPKAEPLGTVKGRLVE